MKYFTSQIKKLIILIIINGFFAMESNPDNIEQATQDGQRNPKNQEESEHQKQLIEYPKSHHLTRDGSPLESPSKNETDDQPTPFATSRPLWEIDPKKLYSRVIRKGQTSASSSKSSFSSYYNPSSIYNKSDFLPKFNTATIDPIEKSTISEPKTTISETLKPSSSNEEEKQREPDNK
jgi:hypothetical protein